MDGSLYQIALGCPNLDRAADFMEAFSDCPRSRGLILPVWSSSEWERRVFSSIDQSHLNLDRRFFIYSSSTFSGGVRVPSREGRPFRVRASFDPYRQ